MKLLLILIICIALSMICMHPACGMQDVGAEFGTSWLETYGTKPVSTLEIQKNLWDWGNAPKGYKVHNGVLYPPGFEPQWYYPSFLANNSPIILNNTIASNYLMPSSQSPNSLYTDPWLLSQLSGRPVAMVRVPESLLF
jgi:hypothetical protein